MKRIGILGGISHESTAVYYQRLHSECFARRHDYYYPEVIVYSLNFQKFTDYEDRGEMKPYIEYILQGMDTLQQAGADFALMALPLLLQSSDTTIPLLDTLTLHVQAAIDYALG